MKPTDSAHVPRRKFLKLSAFLSTVPFLTYFHSLKARAGGFISFAFLKKQVPVVVPTYVEDVFSIDLFTGTGATQSITNNIDFTGKGGAVWSATRTGSDGNGPEIISTLRGGNKRALTASLTAEYTLSDPITFNNNGFTMTSTVNTYINSSGYTKVAWSFRKQAKFFDMVTWTGDGTASRQIPHSLGDVPGLVFVKHLSTATRNWFVLSEPLAVLNARADIGLYLNTTGSSITYWCLDGATNSKTALKARNFDYGAPCTVGNENGTTYVAYIFGNDSSASGMIRSGLYTGNGSATGPKVILGWEPQFILIKNSTGTGNWQMLDTMRGLVVGGADANLLANSAAAEASNDFVSVQSTGFQITSASTEVNTNASVYVYMAIRRPNKPPTSATQVFSPNIYTSTGGDNLVTTGFVTDFTIVKNRSAGDLNTYISNRLSGFSYMNSNLNTAEATTYGCKFDKNNSFAESYAFSAGRNLFSYAFRRAPGFMDIVCYTGDGLGTTNINHNLGVTPELVILKSRSTGDWYTNFFFGGSNNFWMGNGMNSSNAVLYSGTVSSVFGSNSLLSSTVFNPYQCSNGNTNSGYANGSNYTAYLFASLGGISKVGSYTGSTSGSVVVNCGFVGSARFVLIKRTDAAGDWIVVDSARGSSFYSTLNTATAEVNTSVVTLTTGGFTTAAPGAITNASGTANYVYFAIA